MSYHIPAIVKNGDLLFDETTGSSYFDEEFSIYDSSSGKWYRTFFDLEQAYYESNLYSSGSTPDPPDIESMKFELTPIVFKPAEMDIDSLIASVTPTFTQRLDGVWIVGYNTVPNPIISYSIASDDLF